MTTVTKNKIPYDQQIVSPGYGHITPMDQYNQQLLENVHPSDWVNPDPAEHYHLVVIGAGTAGLVTAAGAAGLGARVALVERHLLGGDCLNVGCVPSKAIIHSSLISSTMLNAELFGIKMPTEIEIDFSSVMQRMRQLRTKVSKHDSAMRLRDHGVDVFFGQGKFADKKSIEVDGKLLKFKKAVIATGARAVIPPIEGLKEAGFLTNETVFSLTQRPPRLALFGAGPLGCELAQAFSRLGCKVTIIQRSSHMLRQEDPDAAEILYNAFLCEGIEVKVNTTVNRVSLNGREKILHTISNNHESTITVDEILIGAGRVPNVEGMNLESANVRFGKRDGVTVDDFLRTTNPNIFAAGDACLKHKFTHTADATARIVIQNALFAGRKKLSNLIIPWCTYTDPAIAHVGMYEKDAAEAGIAVQTLIRSFSEVDRAITDSQEQGMLKIHLKKGTDKIIGATLVSKSAGDMISEITLAMANKIGLKKIANVIHPYPTRAETIRQIAADYNRSRLTPLLKTISKKWLALTN